MSSIKIGQRVKKTEANPHGYVKVDNIPANEVCVLYLGGDGATSDKAANGYAKIIENEILDGIEAEIPVYSITYNFEGRGQAIARRISNIKHRAEVLKSKAALDKTVSQATDEDYNPKYVDELFEKVILPRISLRNGKGMISAEEACKRIRKLNIVAHCHGAYTALKLEEKMQAAMKKMGYSENDRKLIQSQMLVVAHAPACTLGVSKSQFISFRSAYDGDIPLKGNFFDSYIEMRKAEECRRFEAEENQDSELAEKNRWFDLEPCFFDGKQGNLFLIKQRYEWIDGLGPLMINKDEHNRLSYNDKKQTAQGRMLAHFAKTILRNGIKNSLLQDDKMTPLPPLESLVISGNASTKEKEQRAFEKMKKNGESFRKEVAREAMRYYREKHARA